MTRPAGARSSRDGSGSPSKRTRPYGSSSITSRSRSSASSTSARRRSSDSVRPLGFWKVGIVYRNAGFVSSSASSTRPSSSMGTPVISAPRPLRIFSGRSYVGASTSTRLLSPRSRCCQRKARPWSEPFETKTRSRLDAVPLGEELAERREARGRPVLRRVALLALEDGERARADLLDRQAVGAGDSAGERDHASSLGKNPEEVGEGLDDLRPRRRAPRDRSARA